jgi:hypothetical protein
VCSSDLIAVDNPGDIRLDVIAAAAQLLVLSESWHPGWQATIAVDAPRSESTQVSAATPTRLPIVRAYGDFMACEVPAGRHRVAFRFAPDSLRHAVLLSLTAMAATFGFTVAGVTIARFRDRRRPKN